MPLVKLRDLPMSEILQTYNNAATTLGRPKVKRFADRNTAIKRTEAIQKELPPEPLVLEPTKSRRSRGFNFPLGVVKKMRRGTLRAALRDLLRSEDGVTYEQVVDCVVRYDKAQGLEPYNLDSRPYEALRLLHLYCGYGLREDDKGKIYLLGEDVA